MKSAGVSDRSESSGMVETLRKTVAFLSPREKRWLCLLLVIVVVMALFELAGVVAVMPFLAVVSRPELVETHPILSVVYARLGFASADRFMIFLGVAAFLILVAAAVVRMVGQYALIRFAQMRRHAIGSRLLEGYLGRPYEFYLGRHSGELSKAILSEVDVVVQSVLQPAALMLGHGVTLVAIAGLLVVVDPAIALGSAAVLCLTYFAVYGRVRGILIRSGVRRAAANAERFKATSEALGGIKDIKLLGRERAYLRRFDRSSLVLAQEISRSSTLSDVPRYAIEAVAFGGIILICVALLMRGDGFDAALPLLGLFALAAYRMMPAIQAIYRGVTQIGFGAAAVEVLHRDLLENRSESAMLAGAPAAPMGLREALVLDHVSYRYPGAGAAGVAEVSLTLPALTSLGVVGGTGAGKTTLVDVILGLLEPQAGRLLVDGVPLGRGNLAAWRAGIGYVPQEIFLLDASISENIAMGLPEAEIDPARIRRAAEMARLDGFVSELPEGYDTQIGERGVRLSGGQRQRIGIARALYHEPDIIVFDEATSALDNATEAEVMAAIDGLAGKKTVIMIAHRLTTVRKCDRILVLDRGRVAGIGSYDALSADNAAFRRIAGAAG